MKSNTVVELKGVNGEWFTLAGPNSGDRGVYLDTGVTGFFDPPVKVTWEEPGNWPGSRYLSHRVQKRDMVFAVNIMHEPGDSWMSRDGDWRKAWSFEKDCTLYVTTEEYGTRWIKVRLGESPEIDTFMDPAMNGVNQCKMVVVASDPFWYGDDVVYSAVTKTDTRFDPNRFGWPWPVRELPKETLVIDIDPANGGDGVNPTDQVIFPKWTVPGSTMKPAEPYIPGIPWLGAPKSHGNIWWIPDYSWKGDEDAKRTLRLPPLIGGLRTRCVQAVSISGRPTGGTFTLKFGTETTAPIDWNATPTEFEAALIALAQIDRGSVDVHREPKVREVQEFEIQGGATGGTYTLEFDGEVTRPITFKENNLGVAQALLTLPSLHLFNITVEEESDDCIQEISLRGDPLGGTFTLSLDGHETGPIPWNASDLQVATKLAALPNIGPFAVSVSGSPWTRIGKQGGPWKVRFRGSLSGTQIQPLVGNADQLYGGAGISVHTKMVNPGFQRHTVTFVGNLAGFNLPQMVGHAGGLTGGKDNKITTKTVRDGERPWVVTFIDKLEGLDVPTFEGDATAVTFKGTTKPTVDVQLRQKGATAPAENCVIDSDPRVEQIVSESGSSVWARMNGVRWRYPVPPYTKSGKFELAVSGCDTGQMVTLRLPRPWSRPWGLH